MQIDQADELRENADVRSRPMTTQTQPVPTLDRKLAVAVFGLRGFPGVQGGIERHCEKLYPRLVARGVDVTVIARSRYQPPTRQPASRPGMRFVRLGSVYSAGMEAFVHSALAALWCIWKRPDVTHVHAIGPALFVPLLRAFGLRVVVTHHGFDYQRQKWGAFARRMLRFGERMAARHANRCIVISEGIREVLTSEHGARTALIPNGVEIQPDMPPAVSDPVMKRFGLAANRYLICVGRLVPEKRQADLVEAWSMLSPADRMGWKLVIVGGADHHSPYVDELHGRIAKSADVVATGVQTGDVLEALWQRAGGCLLPSSHEGLPIVMLEAMSHRLPLLASDIAPNLEVGLPAECYLPVGDPAAWAQAMRRLIAQAERAGAAGSQTTSPLRVEEFRRRVVARYDWDQIADRTVEVYEAVRASR